MLDFLSVFFQYADQWGPRLARAAVVSAQISFMGFLVATVLGLALALMRMTKSRTFQAIARAYILVFRGVPVLAVLLLLYFGLPGIGILFSPIEAAVIGLGLAYAAQMAEVFRGGFQAILAGQWESAAAVGFTPWQSLRLIILPQVVRIIMAPVIVTFVTLLKDSSLAALITVNELLLEGRALASEYFLPLHIYIWVGAMYFAIAFPLSIMAKHLANRANSRVRQ